MAINPNTDFTTGQVLLASEQNRFPRGVMSFTMHTSNVSFAAETTIITGNAFTAVANRYYRITYFEPTLTNTAAGYAVVKIKNGATVLNSCNSPQFNNDAAGYQSILVDIRTFSAGSVTLTATLQSTGAGTAKATSTQYGFLLVEDIGPA